MNRIRYGMPFLLAGVLFATPVTAQEPVYQDYWGVIVDAWGPQASVIPLGERVLLSYNLSPGALDANDNPNTGTYPGGLHGTRVWIADADIEFTGGWGLVRAFNDVPDDAFSLFTMDIPAGSALDGSAIQDIEMWLRGTAAMLDDDSLPLHPLDAYEGTVDVSTPAGQSGFRFVLDAQPVGTSGEAFEFAPTARGERSHWASLMYRNEGGESVEVTGFGSSGPFKVAADCLDRGILEPGGDCMMSMRFVPRHPFPLGVIEGRLGVRFSSGLVDRPARAFVYSRKARPGVANLGDSLEPLGFRGPAIRMIDRHLVQVERALRHGRPHGYRKACPHLRHIVRRVENEAARERVADWSALAMIVQTQAVWKNLRCPGRMP